MNYIGLRSICSIKNQILLGLEKNTIIFNDEGESVGKLPFQFKKTTFLAYDEYKHRLYIGHGESLLSVFSPILHRI